MNPYLIVCFSLLGIVLSKQEVSKDSVLTQHSEAPQLSGLEFHQEKRQTMYTQVKLLPNDLEENARFGQSVALSSDGNTALIGAFRKNEGGFDDEGVGYVFTSNGTTGQWSQQVKLVADELEANAQSGWSVSLSSDGNTALIGAPGKNEGGFSNAGACFVFIRNAAGQWLRQVKFVAGDLEEEAAFGFSLALSSDGNTALIGAPWKDESGMPDAGASYVFVRDNAGQWSQSAKLMFAEANALFGHSVSLSSDGNTALIGAPQKDDGVFADAGTAFVFTHNGGQWSQPVKLVAKDMEIGAFFGRSLDLSSDGNTALIGAPEERVGGLNRAGSVYIFIRNGDQWSQQMKLVADVVESDDRFGHSVALSANGSIALVGAFGRDEGSFSDAGILYLYTRNGKQWSLQQRIAAFDVEADAWFGWSVASSSDGSTALIGASNKDEQGNGNAGASYVITRPRPTTSSPTVKTATFSPTPTPLMNANPTPLPTPLTISPTSSLPLVSTVFIPPRSSQSPDVHGARDPVPAPSSPPAQTNAVPTSLIVAVVIGLLCLLIVSVVAIWFTKRPRGDSSPTATATQMTAASNVVGPTKGPRSRTTSRSALKRQSSSSSSHFDAPARRSRSASRGGNERSRSSSRSSPGGHHQYGNFHHQYVGMPSKHTQAMSSSSLAAYDTVPPSNSVVYDVISPIDQPTSMYSIPPLAEQEQEQERRSPHYTQLGPAPSPSQEIQRAEKLFDQQQRAAAEVIAKLPGGSPTLMVRQVQQAVRHEQVAEELRDHLNY